MLTFLFAATLVVATPWVRASQVTMDAKIRDDSDLSQVSSSEFPANLVSRVSAASFFEFLRVPSHNRRDPTIRATPRLSLELRVETSASNERTHSRTSALRARVPCVTRECASTGNSNATASLLVPQPQSLRAT
ncbi:hypothetical protein HN011_000620 [Eciton burchellii]|nr:hypothetical protein HN011_000620 [Eciton burchellii]